MTIALGRQAAANVGNGERIGSAVAGAALVLRAVARPTLGRIVLAVGGAVLLLRALTGHCALYRSLGIDTAGRGEPHADPVEAASEDSFPASDPPSWTPVVGAIVR